MEEETQEIQLDQRGDEYSGYGFGWKACIRACHTQYENESYRISFMDNMYSL